MTNIPIQRTASRLFSFLFLTILSILMSCEEKVPTGQIEVRAPNPGEYEIYRISSQNPLQFVSEQVGRFNQSVDLTIGDYLILADCSFERITVAANEKTELVAHRVIFNPPRQPQNSDLFSIQCNRFSKTRSRQHLSNRYELNILHGNRQLLVGMVPLKIEFDQEKADEPQIKQFDLAGVKVKAYENIPPKTSFFVSPTDARIAVTANQEFGNWLFLLPGSYHIEVNGTQLTLPLAAGNSHEIEPAFLRVSVPDGIDLALSPNIVGTPLYVELNETHWIDLNRIYPLLPGKATIKLNGSQKSYPIELVAGELLEKKTRSIVVSFDCPPWEWTCLGSRKVFLYNTEKAYPFAEGVSDVPLLFFEEDAWVSVQGSRDIRYKLKPEKEVYKLSVGVVVFKPQYAYRPNLISDLSRIEAIDLPYAGHSLDLPIESESRIPLIAGPYHLAQYTSNYAGEYERRPSKRWFFVKAHQEIEMKYTVLVSEKKLQTLRNMQEKSDRRRSKKKLSRLNSFHSIIPAEIF